MSEALASLPSQAKSKGPRCMPKTVLQETVASENPANLCQALRWSLPALPSVSRETKAITELTLKGNADNSNSIHNLLKVINGQLDLLSQTLSRIPLCHQSEISRATSELRQENDQLRKRSGMLFQCGVPLATYKEEPIQEKETPMARAKRLAAGNPQGMVVMPCSPSPTPTATQTPTVSRMEVPQPTVEPAGMNSAKEPDQVLWPPPETKEIARTSVAVDLSSLDREMGISGQRSVQMGGEESVRREPSRVSFFCKEISETTVAEIGKKGVNDMTHDSSDVGEQSMNVFASQLVKPVNLDYSPRDDILPMWCGESSMPLAEYKQDARSKLSISTAHNLAVELNALRNEFDRSTRNAQLETEEAMEESKQKCAWIPILHPHSIKRLVWDLMGGFFIFYDVVVIPLQFLPVGEHEVFTVMQYITIAFWTMDIPRQFLIGFEVASGAEMRPRRIALNYAKSWMIPDVSIVVIDWLCMYVVTGASGGPSRTFKVAKSVKALRLLRLLRLARVVKIPGLLSRVFDSMQSEHHLAMFKVLGVIILVALFAHYTGCYLYVLGDVNILQHETNWLRENGIEEAPVGVIYIAGVSWAMARSGLLDSELQPTNVSEHLFTWSIALSWLVIICFTASFFTISIYAIREANLARVHEETRIRRYLRQHAISTALTGMIMQHYRHDFLKRERRLHEEDVSLVVELPHDLRIKLHTQVYLPVLKKHPAFNAWSNSGTMTLLSVCHLCCSEHTCLAGDFLFQEGKEAIGARYLSRGHATYLFEGERETVQEGEWVSEACLWMRFDHGGTLIANTTLEWVSISAKSFVAIVGESASKIDMKFLQAYAESVVSYFGREAPKSDLWDMDEIQGFVKDLQRKSSLGGNPGEQSTQNLIKMGFAGRNSTVVGLDTLADI